MDTCCTSQKKVREGLRSRRVVVDVHAPFPDPMNSKKKPEAIKLNSKKAKFDAVIVTPKETSYSGETTLRDPDVNDFANASKTGKGISTVKSKRNMLSESENQNARVLESDWLEDAMDDDVNDDNRSEIASTGDNHQNVNDNQSVTPSVDDIQEYQDDVELSDDGKNSDAEGLQGDCLEDVLKEVNKDIGALYSKTNKIEANLKEIKKILLTRPSQHCIRTISSRFKQKTSFSLLPKLPLKKKSAVRKMDWNAEDDDNEEYKDQLVMKMASFGGDTVNELVINIFKKLFSTKLKTKYCWKGTTRGKHAFKRLTGIREAIWSAVKIHFNDCTESTVNKEIKLRLNQAQKDYDRELLKERNSVEN